MTRSGRLAAGGAGFVLVLIFVAVGVRLVLRGPAEVETVVPIPPATSGDLTLLFFGDSGTGSQVQVQVCAQAQAAFPDENQAPSQSGCSNTSSPDMTPPSTVLVRDSSFSSIYF